MGLWVFLRSGLEGGNKNGPGFPGPRFGIYRKVKKNGLVQAFAAGAVVLDCEQDSCGDGVDA